MPPPQKRLSCDRCHAQKLRCPRQNYDDSESCARCLRQGAHCVYSVPLPKGRPRTNHPPPSSAGVTPTTPYIGASATYSSSSNPTPNAATKPMFADGSRLLPNVTAATSFGPRSGYPPCTSGIASYSDIANAWNAATCDKSVADMSTSSASAHHGEWAWALDAYSNIASPPNVNGISNLTTNVATVDADDTELCVRQLSDLTARLYPIYRTSRTFSEPVDDNPGPFITTAAFEAVGALFNSSQQQYALGPAAMTSNALRETFSASRSLLEIVSRLLDAAVVNGSVDSGVAPGPGISHTSRSSFGSVSQIVGGPRSSHSHESAVYHLVIACYSLLLHIYGTLIPALQRDALSHARGGDAYSPPSMVELRLVVLMQLIAYFLDRLQQVMHAYTSQLDGTVAQLENKARYGLGEFQRALIHARQRPDHES